MNTTEKLKSELDTPCLVLDMDILERNLQKMRTFADSAGKKLRPHAKTHKCSALAKKQIEMGAIGVCVAKVSEAEALVKTGIKEILITGPIASKPKIERFVNLLEEAPSLTLVIDHASCIDSLEQPLKQKGISANVLLDIDVGLNRTGAQASEAMNLARKILSSQNLNLRGVQAYAGHLQHVISYESRKKASLDCLAEAVEIFRELRESNPECVIFSASGTGTFDIDIAIPEISEFQVGSYVCMDTEYIEIGSAENDAKFATFEPALRLLTTVVSANHKDFVTVDAGLKSLYKDGGKPQIIGSPKNALEYDWFGDEYGKISSSGNSKLPKLGTSIELITSHCDPTVNLFDNYILTRGEEVVGSWDIDLRGCSQ